jgi:hypothetical protein
VLAVLVISLDGRASFPVSRLASSCPKCKVGHPGLVAKPSVGQFTQAARHAIEQGTQDTGIGELKIFPEFFLGFAVIFVDCFQN